MRPLQSRLSQWRQLSRVSHRKTGQKRQCVGCKKVLPKHELLRFVQEKQGKIVHDRQQRLMGRGFYLCPSHVCFYRAAKNKKMRAYPRDEKKLMSLISETETSILVSIEKKLQLLGRSGHAKSLSQPEKEVTHGDIVLIPEDLPDEKQYIFRQLTIERGAHLFRLPESLIRPTTVCIAKGACSLCEPLLKELQMYERLSPKGQAL